MFIWRLGRMGRKRGVVARLLVLRREGAGAQLIQREVDAVFQFRRGWWLGRWIGMSLLVSEGPTFRKQVLVGLANDLCGQVLTRSSL
jgi:hypothetical protein